MGTFPPPALSMISIKRDLSGGHFMNLSLLSTLIRFNKLPRIFRFLLFVSVFFIPAKLMAEENVKLNAPQRLDLPKQKE